MGRRTLTWATEKCEPEVLMVRVPICSTSFQRWNERREQNENEENSLEYPLNCLSHSHLQHTHTRARARTYWNTSGRELPLILKYDNIVVPFISIWTR